MGLANAGKVASPLVLGRDVGVAVGDLSRLLNHVDRRMFADVEFDKEELRQQLADHPRLTFVLAHGGLISWLPITSLLINSLAECSPDRLGTGTFHRAMWKIPGLGNVARFFSGAKRPLKFDELLGALSSGNCDFYAFPESENSLYGDLHEIKPFRFFRFIALSVEAQMPMMLLAHKGSEHWYRPIGPPRALMHALPQSLYSFFQLKKDQVLAETAQQTVNLPVPIGRIKLRVRTQLLKPLYYDTGFSRDPDVKREQLREEGARVRTRLQALSDSIS